MQRSLAKRLWYNFLHGFLRIFFVAFGQLRIAGRHFEPASGGVLVLSNHQSHLDPVLVGISCQRRLNYLARKTLFRFAPLRWMIVSVDAIPIDREGVGLSGLKETLRRLKRGEMVLIFPEGTRSRDGQVARLKPGFCALARRGKVPLLPVGIDGAFRAYPRSHLLPRPAAIQIQFGPPLSPEEVAGMSDEELVAEVRRRIVACHATAQAANRRARGCSQPGD